MIIKKFLFLLFFSVLLVSSVNAVNWYVDNAVATSGNGQSWNTAWKSFSNIAWSSVQPGDTIYISGGNTGKSYYESMIVGASGTAGNQITITKGVDVNHNGLVTLDGQLIRGDGVYIKNKRYITVSNLRFRDGARVEIRGDSGSSYVSSSASKYIIVENCDFFVTVHGGVFVQTSDHIVIRHNKFDTPKNTTAQTDGIYSQRNYDNIYEHNYILMNNNWIGDPNNSSDDGHNDGIQSYLDTDNIYRYNFIWQNNTKQSNAQGIYITTSNGTLLAYGNVIYGPSTKNALLTNANYAGSNAKMLAYGNTLVGGGWGVLAFKDSPNSEAKNNIIMSDKTGIVLPRIDGVMIPPSNWDYNLYYAPNSASFFDSNIRTFAQWQAAGYDIHGKYGDPKFINILMQNFELLSTSPGIDAGVNLGLAYSFDKRGISRPQGAGYDIGAYEFVSGVQCNVADNNCDNCISLGEISAYVGRWLTGTGQVTLSQASTAVSSWMQGC